MIAQEKQTLPFERHVHYGTIARIPDGTQASLKRLCGFYGGSEPELLARLIADLERDTLALLPTTEQEEYFSAAA